MKSYELFKAHYTNRGMDPFIVGMNFARMGFSFTDANDRYGISYGTDFFTDLLNGYNNAYNEEFTSGLTVVSKFETDTKYIFDKLTSHKLVKDFSFGHFDYVNFLDSTATTITGTVERGHLHFHFTIIFYESVHQEGVFHSHWHIGYDITHNIGKIQSMRNIKYEIDGFKWRGRDNCRSSQKSGGWFETEYDWRIPRSSVIAELIDKIINDALEYFSLPAYEDRPTVTIGDILEKQLSARYF